MLPLVSLLLSIQAVCARKITVKNSCGTTIYPAYAGKGGTVTVGGQAAPGGWELEAGGSTVLEVPEGWHDARIWIRSGGCDGDVTKCLIGWCKSKGLLWWVTSLLGLVGHADDGDGTEFGSLGATVAEFNINNLDFYDVSMVEGFTVPVSIIPSDGSCETGSCGIDADPLLNCDARLVYPLGSQQIWGCANPCTAGVQFTALDGGIFNADTSPSCCHGSYENEACTHDVIPFYSALKALCKNGYVYAKDDLPFGETQTAVFACSTKPSYTVEFCTGGVNTGIKGALPASAAKAMYVGTGGQLNVGGTGGDGGGDTTISQSMAIGTTPTSTSTPPLPLSTAETYSTVVTQSTDDEGTVVTEVASNAVTASWGGRHGRGRSSTMQGVEAHQDATETASPSSSTKTCQKTKRKRAERYPAPDPHA